MPQAIWQMAPRCGTVLPIQQFDIDVLIIQVRPAGSCVAPEVQRLRSHPIPDEHIEDRMAKEAVAFLEKHRDEPFFLNYWMFSVHARSMQSKH